MQNNTKNDGISWGAMAHSAQRLRGPWPRFVTTGVVNLKKKPLFWEEKILMLWILRSRNASTNTIIFFIITVGKSSSHCQPREHLEQGFFSAHWTCVNVFFWTEELCRILFLPICTSRIYSVHVYMFSKINQPVTPSPPPASEMVRPTNREISHVSYFLCHATCAPRSSHW